MKKILTRVLLLTFLLTTFIPTTAFAYSYGKDDQEPLANSYSKVAAALNTNNGKVVDSEFKAHKAELTKEFGATLVKQTEAAIKAKNKNNVLIDYRHYLTLNVKRRLSSAIANIKDYKKAKMMVAKATATYEVLAPVVKSKKAASHTAIDAALEKAAVAIGNPGLFGTGAKPADLKALTASIDTINKNLASLFPVRKVTPVKPVTKR